MTETNFTYDEAHSQIDRVLIKGLRFKADVFIAQPGGRRFVIKDFSQKGFWERNLIGRIVIGREARAYAALAGIEGIPSGFKRLSPFSFAVEYLEGTDFGGVDQARIDSGVMRQFERIIRDFHDRGWVHLDLHRRTNILFIRGRVYVIDLASALHPGMIPLIGRCLTRLIGLADRLSLIKMKTIFAPETLTVEERRILSLRNRIMPSKWRAS
jgi:hypothetical protein